ncbi:Ref family recombination enhancement nuclease [Pseudomonas viridiflava]|uniref:Ref family recombination enhancement nuclease n=1 Tax=Pseudomonas viridiflava TaxID=33069 RepID=UPI000F02FCD4|nr:Ref family recombination enhancement nuclease [Pseudomonas viridiflava]
MIGGKSVNSRERAWHDTVADICGCVCCVLDGRLRDHTLPAHVSIHHCDGRTKRHAHWYVLPLCDGHHQQGTGPLKTMLAVHGNKAEFIAAYAREIELVEICSQLVQASGREVPGEVHALLAKWHSSQQYLNHENRGAA